MRWTVFWLFLSIPVYAADIGSLLNAERQSVGLHTLMHSPALERAAEAHALDMARNRFFSHNGSDGSHVWDRVGAAGYRYCYVAENIAKGQQTAEDTMRSWMQSKGHRLNNLSKDAAHYGAARATGDYWVLVFGSVDC